MMTKIAIENENKNQLVKQQMKIVTLKKDDCVRRKQMEIKAD